MTITKTTQEQDKLAKLVLSRYRDAHFWRNSVKLAKGLSVPEWIDRCTRMYHSIHEDCELNVYPHMRSYLPIGRIKVDSAVGWARDLLADKIDMPWVYRPTPDPELSTKGKDKVKTMMLARLKQELLAKGITFPPEVVLAAGGGKMPQQLEKLLEQEQENFEAIVISEETRMAEKACKLAQRYGKDWQQVSGFSKAIVPFLRDVYAMPCGVLGGPFKTNVPKRTYKGSRYVRSIEEGWTYRHIACKNAYFAPDATSAKDGAYFIERTFRSREDLIRMIGMEGVIDDNVKKVISESKEQTVSWLSSIENKELLSGTGLISFNARQDGPINSTHGYATGIESIIMQGQLTGKELQEYGITGVETFKSYECEVEICGNLTIRAEVNNAVGGRSYCSTGFSESDLPWRDSILTLVSDCQMNVNRIAYNRIRAIHQQSGSFMGVNASAWDGSVPRFDPFGAAAYNTAPGSDGGRAPMQMYQASPTFNALYNELLNEFYIADTVTAIPRFDRDISGQAERQTATESGIRYASAVRRQKSVAANLDMEVLKPLGERTYELLLEKYPKLQNSADAWVDATGIVGALNKDAQDARLVEALMPLTKAAEAGIVPNDIVQQLWRAYSEKSGVDVSSWPDPLEQSDLTSALTNNPNLPIGTNAPLPPNVNLPEQPLGLGGAQTAPVTGIPLAQGQTL